MAATRKGTRRIAHPPLLTPRIRRMLVQRRIQEEILGNQTVTDTTIIEHSFFFGKHVTSAVPKSFSPRNSCLDDLSSASDELHVLSNTSCTRHPSYSHQTLTPMFVDRSLTRHSRLLLSFI